MKRNGILNNERFLVGNIGPDCGVPNEDWSSFTPDKKVTHWWSKDGAFIDADDFRRRCLGRTDERYPFYLGYYFHLLTDIEWIEFFSRKKKEPVYAEGFKRGGDFIWEVKKDWYGQDHLFLQRNRDFVFFKVFAQIDEFDNAYFDFYPRDAFIRQIRYITQFYLNAAEDPGRDFPYLKTWEMDDFVLRTIEKIEGIIPAV